LNRTNHVLRQNSDCAKLSRQNEYATKSYKKINKMNMTHNLGYNPFWIYY